MKSKSAKECREKGTCYWCGKVEPHIKNVKQSIYCKSCQQKAKELPRPRRYA